MFLVMAVYMLWGDTLTLYFSSCSAYSVSVTQGFLRFASLCVVFSVSLVRGIVRSLLVLSMFVLGRGGGVGSVAIGQCCIYVRSLGWRLGILCGMGHSRWSEVA